MRENKSTDTTTAATGPIIVPKRPSINVSGMKATMVVKTPKVTGSATSMVPLMDASIPASPIFNLRYTDSPVTMASSTTIPSTTINPNALIRFKVIPNAAITENAPRKLMGMPMNTQMAILGRRNRVNKAMTRKVPCAALLPSTPKRFFSCWALSSQNSRDIPSGRLS